MQLTIEIDEQINFAYILFGFCILEKTNNLTLHLPTLNDIMLCFFFSLATFVFQLQDETYFNFGPSALTFKFDLIFKYCLSSINRKYLLDEMIFLF